MADEFRVPWPTRPDGSNMTMGEMTPEQRRAQWKAAAIRWRARGEQPAAPEAA